MKMTTLYPEREAIPRRTRRSSILSSGFFNLTHHKSEIRINRIPGRQN